jgi:SAM-dependent methyltransferase
LAVSTSFFSVGCGDEHPINATQANAIPNPLRITIEYAMLKSVPPMPSYDDFAWFYDRYWNEEFHGLAFPILERIWVPRLPAGGRLLDVCSGTGYLAGLLAGRGFHVTGVELSPEMTAFARRNVPAAEFVTSDAAEFQLAPAFDGAVSTFDSLNHILGHDRLEATFRNTAAALKPGAPFVFDVLFEEAYRTHWGEAFVLVRDDHVLTITGAGYDFRTRTAQCSLTMFRLIDGAWRRADSTVHEQCYTAAEIDGALAGAGFGDIACYDARDLGMGGQLGEGRTFYVATKQPRRASGRNSGRALPSSGR